MRTKSGQAGKQASERESKMLLPTKSVRASEMVLPNKSVTMRKARSVLVRVLQRKGVCVLCASAMNIARLSLLVDSNLLLRLEVFKRNLQVISFHLFDI